MNQLQVFDYKNTQFRTVEIDGEPWFVAKDVCRVLEIGNITDAMSRIDDDEKGFTSIETPGGNQEMSIVNEPGLYVLILGSRKQEAKLFKRWITHEVIPAIRKTGSYTLKQQQFQIPKTYGQALQLAADLQKQIEENAPKVLFADTCMKSNESILIRELAKIACGEGLNTGEHRLYKALRQWGLLNPNNEPYQRYVSAGYFEIAETPYETEYGTRLARTTRVLPRGQQYIINRIKAEG